MSILAIRKWQQFSAPVFIGKKSSITGSWTRCHQVSPYELAMAPNILFHLRLSTWKQECPSGVTDVCVCLLYTSPSPRDAHESRMPSSA